MCRALEEGLVAAAAFDVLSKEPCTDSPLYKYENFLVTPHIGATTWEAQQNVGISVVNEVASALRGEMVPNAVNLPVIHNEDMKKLSPYLRLCEVLGKFYHQLEKAPVDKVEVCFAGEASKL
ncbi:MAG: NAD(P)-dependent oxidoreductase, partial [Clostridiales bacterium]